MIIMSIIFRWKLVEIVRAKAINACTTIDDDERLIHFRETF